MERQPSVKIEGSVETVVYANEDSGFVVLELDVQGQLVTVVGELGEVAEGERLTVHGSYTTHPTYGTQFKAVACEHTLPATAAAIERYLASGAVKGIGPVLARRMVEAFGDETLAIMEKEPERLMEVRGISPAKYQKIREEFARLFGIRVTMLFLGQFGVDSSTSIAAWKRWGSRTQEVVRQDPYVLCDEEMGLEFDRCDQIARQLELPPDSSCRIRAGLRFVLRHNLQNGHTCLPCDKMIPATAGLLEQSETMVEAELRQMLRDQEARLLRVEGRDYCYLPEYLQAERDIAAKVEILLRCPPEEQKNWEREIASLERESGIRYASLQKEAIRQAMENRLFVLTGGPGTGKTTAINAILELYRRMEKKVALCAPTGRAAKRMSEVTGYEAKTIHRLLEVEFGQGSGLRFKRNERNPLPFDVVIVDEVSMVDVPLMQALLAAIRMSCRLILVGDSDQLPSVGPGNVLKDLIECGKVATVRLTEIFRQAQESLIVTNAHAIVGGQMPDLSRRDRDCFFLRRASYEQMKGTVVDLVQSRLPRSYGYSPWQDIQVIAPTRVGPVGTNSLNQELQRVLNPPSREKDELEYHGRLLRTGDKVMQVKNNYDILWTREDGEEGVGVYNGDIGVITMIDHPSKTIQIRYDDRTANYLFEMADQIELAYAITVHKSQGSEFEAVILPLMHHKSKMHYRNLLYTAVTRARSTLILLGVEATVAQMVENDRRTVRYTNLRELLQGEGEEL